MAARNNPNTEITEEEFNEIVNNSHKLVVVDFFAEWCMPCLMLAPIVEEIAENMKEVKFVRINKEDNPELASKHNIMGIPCLVIFKEGKEAGRITGSHSQDVIENRIKEHL